MRSTFLLSPAGLLLFVLYAKPAAAQAEPRDEDVEINAAPASAPPAPTPTPQETPPAAAPPPERVQPVAPAPEAPPPPPKDEPTPVIGTREPSLTRGLAGPLGIYASGYVQAQFETSQLSEDQLQQGGLPLNQDRFLVRRARVRLDRSWQWAHAAIEIDGNTTRGATFGLRRAEASLVYRNARDASQPPWVRVTAGLSEIPFGYELTDSSRSRVFMERSTGSLALFPGEPDVGVRVSGGVGFFRYVVSAINGEPIDDRPGRAALVRDPNASKDLVARVGVDTPLLAESHGPGAETSNVLSLRGGVSFLTGKGFHPGADATKNEVVWRDLNENGVLDAGELTAVPAAAATPSQSFGRWAVGLDLGVTLETRRFGRTRVYGELFAAQNADRGVFAADPIATGSDVREVGYYIALLQDVTRYGVVGFRVDRYDPNADFLDKRVGRLVPADASITTLSPLVGLTLEEAHVRVLFQYDVIADKLARDASGVPTDLQNNQLTLRVQGEL